MNIFILNFKKMIIFIKNIVITIIYGFIFLLALVVSPLIFGYHPTVVLTGSMEPTLKTGSVIYYQETSYKNIEIGDMLVFRTDNNNLVTHRVVEIKDNNFITKGDANKVNDSIPVSPEKVVGKAKSTNILFIGYILNYIYNNLYVLIIITALLMLDFVLPNKK